MAYDNFKRIVPAELQQKIKQLAESVEFSDLLSGRQESESEQTIYPIEGNYRSGWIPHQDGGFSVEQFYMCGMDTCRHFTKNQTEWIENSYDDMLELFCQDHGIENPDCIDYDNPDLLDQLCDYENAWFEPALLQFQVFVECEGKFNDESPFNVVCRLSINYKDAPYYREKYAEDILFRVYDFMEFMNTENHVIIDQFRI